MVAGTGESGHQAAGIGGHWRNRVEASAASRPSLRYHAGARHQVIKIINRELYGLTRAMRLWRASRHCEVNSARLYMALEAEKCGVYEIIER